MPGRRSLEENRYYAHPRNQFWPIMGKLFGAGPELSYPKRLARLKKAGIALWDVLKHCRRRGSLDTSILIDSEIPNDIRSLLEEHASIRAVCFNGEKAKKTFLNRVAGTLPRAIHERLSFITLPSTSPANAGKTFAAKLREWKVIKPSGKSQRLLI